MSNQPAPQRLASEKVVISAPLSFTGSAQRIWNLTRLDVARQSPVVKVGMAVLASILVVVAWWFVLCWYLFFGLLLVPYRLLRRGSRKRKRQALQHREMVAAVQGHAPVPQNVVIAPASDSGEHSTQLGTPESLAQLPPPED